MDYSWPTPILRNDLYIWENLQYVQRMSNFNSLAIIMLETISYRFTHNRYKAIRNSRKKYQVNVKQFDTNTSSTNRLLTSWIMNWSSHELRSDHRLIISSKLWIIHTEGGPRICFILEWTSFIRGPSRNVWLTQGGFWQLQLYPILNFPSDDAIMDECIVTERINIFSEVFATMLRQLCSDFSIMNERFNQTIPPAVWWKSRGQLLT